MAVFKKIYKKTNTTDYEEVCVAGGTEELNVYDGTKIGLIPNQPAYKYREVFTAKGWTDMHFTKIEFDDSDHEYDLYTSLSEGSWENNGDSMITIPQTDVLGGSQMRLLDAKEHDKILDLYRGYVEPETDSMGTSYRSIYDTLLGTVAHLNSNNLSLTTKYNSYQNVNNFARDATYNGMLDTSSERVMISDNTLLETAYITVTRKSTSIDITTNVNALIAVTGRIGYNCLTKNNSMEICFNINGKRDAQSAFTVNEGGDWYDQVTKTYIFQLSPGTTNIAYSAKAWKNETKKPIITVVDTEICVLSHSGQYWLQNYRAPGTLDYILS